ncbi:hypothetical protein HDU86_005181 [Geranomyces michiganensis]|nr:hypothetical protein HDU86_005181 [Geranomyces michiganensis]
MEPTPPPPPPPTTCGLDAVRSLDGHVVDHWAFRNDMCVSNRIVLGFSIPAAILSLAVMSAMLVLLISSAITSFGLLLGALGFLVSGSWMLVLNSCTYMVGSQALISAAWATLFQWITVTTKMLHLSDEEWLVLRIKALRKTLLFPTYLVFAFCMPVCVVRAASAGNVIMFNVASLLYFLGMEWMSCASQFSVHFARLIEATVDGTKDFTFTIKKDAATGEARATISELPKQFTPTLHSAMLPALSVTGADGGATTTSNNTANPAQERAEEMLAVARRVRIVGVLIAADKVLFILIYIALIIQGMLAWLKPEMPSWPLGFYAIMLGGIPGANFLVLAMSYYHVSTGPSRASATRSANTTKGLL